MQPQDADAFSGLGQAERGHGALDLERALTQGEKAFEPGLLARAHRRVEALLAAATAGLAAWSAHLHNSVKTLQNGKAASPATARPAKASG